MRQFLLILFSLLFSFQDIHALGKWEGRNHVVLCADRPISGQIIIPNTIYEINTELDLNGARISFQDNCVLRFNGGTIKNGTLEGKSTIIEASLYQVFSNIVFKGTWSVEYIRPEWFGAKGDSKTDDTKALQEALNCNLIAGEDLFIPVRLRPAEYVLNNEVCVKGYGGLVGTATSAQAGYLSKSQSTLVYKGAGRCVVRIENSYTSIKNLSIRIDNKLYKTDGIFYDATKNRVIHNDLSGIYISGARYGISSLLGCEESGFSYANFDGIAVVDCIRGISVESSNKLANSKSSIITYITHCLFHNCTVSTCKEKGIYLEAFSLLDNVKIDYGCFELIGMKSAYDTKYSKSSINAIDISLRGNDPKYETTGLVSISDCYFEGIYYTPGTINNGKYRVDSFDYDNNSVIRVKNINLNVQSNIFENCLTIIRSDGADFINLTANTDEGYWEGKKDSGRFYLCKDNTKTRLFINGYTFKNCVKDAIKSSILTNPVRSIDVNNIYRINSSFQGRMDPHFAYNNRGNNESSLNVYITDNGEGSGVFYGFPTNMNELDYAAFDYSPSISFKLLEDINLTKPILIKRNIDGDVINRQDVVINFDLGGKRLSYKGGGAKVDGVFEIDDVKSFCVKNGAIEYTAPTSLNSVSVIREGKSKLLKSAVSVENVEVRVINKGNQTISLISADKPVISNDVMTELNVIGVTANKTIKKCNNPQGVVLRDCYRNSKIE